MEKNYNELNEILQKLYFLRRDLLNEVFDNDIKDNMKDNLIIVITKIDKILEMIFNIKLAKIKKKDLQKIKEEIKEIQKKIEEIS